MPSEDDGDEIFTRISDVRHCGEQLRISEGFWRCPTCGVSFGPACASVEQKGDDARHD